MFQRQRKATPSEGKGSNVSEVTRSNILEATGREMDYIILYHRSHYTHALVTWRLAARTVTVPKHRIIVIISSKSHNGAYIVF